MLGSSHWVPILGVLLCQGLKGAVGPEARGRNGIALKRVWFFSNMALVSNGQDALNPHGWQGTEHRMTHSSCETTLPNAFPRG